MEANSKWPPYAGLLSAHADIFSVKHLALSEQKQYKKEYFFQEKLWDCRMIESVPTADFAAVMSDDKGKKSLTLSLTAVGHFGHTLLEIEKYSKSTEGKVMLNISYKVELFACY
jgi:hypothetical protein